MSPLRMLIQPHCFTPLHLCCAILSGIASRRDDLDSTHFIRSSSSESKSMASPSYCGLCEDAWRMCSSPAWDCELPRDRQCLFIPGAQLTQVPGACKVLSKCRWHLMSTSPFTPVITAPFLSLNLMISTGPIICCGGEKK